MKEAEQDMAYDLVIDGHENSVTTMWYENDIPYHEDYYIVSEHDSLYDAEHARSMSHSYSGLQFEMEAGQ